MTTLDWIIIISLFVIFFISAIVTTIVIFYKRRWNFSYVVADKSDGRHYSITQRGKCRLMSFGDGGEEIFYLRNIKRWRVAYGKRIGKNQILFVIGKDGYWYNCDFDDFDDKLLKLGVMPIDRDMRYAYASVRKGIDNRYNKQNFMDKYGTIIAFGMLFLCIIAMIGFQWFSFSNQKKIVTAQTEGAKTSLEVMKASKDVLNSLKGVTETQTGFKPANVTIQPVILPTS